MRAPWAILKFGGCDEDLWECQSCHAIEVAVWSHKDRNYQDPTPEFPHKTGCIQVKVVEKAG